MTEPMKIHWGSHKKPKRIKDLSMTAKEHKFLDNVNMDEELDTYFQSKSYVQFKKDWVAKLIFKK